MQQVPSAMDVWKCPCGAWHPNGKACPTSASGYYVNSLEAWLKELLARNRQLQHRLVALEKQEHPCADDQANLITLNEAMIALLDNELADTQARDDALAAFDNARQREINGN